MTLSALAPSAGAGTPAPGFSDTSAATDLSAPTAIAFLPDGGLLATQKGGQLLLFEEGTQTTLITIPVCTDDEMGLLGIAVDPNFADNGFVYLYRTKPGGGATGCDNSGGERVNQLVRVEIENDAVDPVSLQVLLTGIRTDNGNHDGGGVRIGPDGKLYISVGDTGLGDTGPPGASTNPYAQSLSSLEGKVLRTELSGAPAAGNPFIGTPGAREEIFAYGFRNPFRFGFDPVTGRLWLGDVGQGAVEELDIVTSGGNYAWPHCEGTLPIGCQQPGDIPPAFSYPHSGPGALGRTIIGGTFANFGSGPDYFFADYIDSKIYRAVPNAARNGLVGSPTEFVTDADGPVDLVLGPDNALYYVAINSGEIRRVTTPPTPNAVPAPGPGTGTPSDTAAPTQQLRGRRTQGIDGMFITVRLNEPGTLIARGSVNVPVGASRTYPFKSVRRTVAANVTVWIPMKLRKTGRRAARRALRAGRTLKATIDVVARDRSGNASAARTTIRLKATKPSARSRR